MTRPTRPKVLPVESSIRPSLATTIDWANAAETVARIRSDALALGTEMQQALAQAQHENRVRGECLETAVDALKLYSAPADSTARHALNYIRQRLAQLEPEEEAG